ncbi:MULTISPECIES: hypothetical protein [Rhizobium]|uniref:hypothetical protein n=1 Tax=Rhizobium TaxID=379 RepID=UPI000FED8F65|nr:MULTISPECIES: hypothetical protein [Rhizobium]RKE85042.1 hypothetical protein DFO46_1827 [Rhizobium sp. AG855]
MATEPENGETQRPRDTDYAAQSDSGAKPGFVLSAWSLVLGGIALLLIISSLLVI